MQRPLRSKTSTMAAISQMLETVASSMDMVSRLGRSVLIELSASTHAPACSLRQFARESEDVQSKFDDLLQTSARHPASGLLRGCTTYTLAHSLLAYPVRSDTAPRGWSVPSRPPAQQLFRTTAAWAALH